MDRVDRINIEPAHHLLTPSQSPPLPNLHSLSISPYPAPVGDYRYNGVFGPPASAQSAQHQQGGWDSPGKRGSRAAIPPVWYDPLRDSPHPPFDVYRRDASPPALSPPSSTTSGPTTSSSNPYQSYNPNGAYPSNYPSSAYSSAAYPPTAYSSTAYPADHHSFANMALTPSPPPMAFGMNSAASAPNLAGFNAGGMSAFGSQSLASLNQRSSGIWRNGSGNPIQDDDLIPTAIVIKNIPFAVSRESLLAVIESLGAPLPYAFNYHFDNGVFRGLAFANFRAPDEAASVVAALNGYDVQGRKLRVEYKKVLQPGEKDKIEREKALKRMRSIHFDSKDMPPPLSLPVQRQSNGHLNADTDHSPPHSASSATSDSLPVALDLNDQAALDIYSRVLVFKEDRMRDELAFSRSLNPTERRIVHLVAQKLSLNSITKADGEIKYVVVTRESSSRPTLTTSTSASISSSYLSPYSTTPSDLSPSLRIKKSMPDLRGFNGPVVARDPAGRLTPQRSSGNLRGDMNGSSREYVSMGAAQGRRANGFGSGSFNSMFGSPIGEIPPVPPLPAGFGGISQSRPHPNPALNGSSPDGSTLTENGVPSHPLRNPRGPAGESRGFGGTLRASASAVLRGSVPLGRRLSEEEEDVESVRTRDSLDL